MQGEAAAHGGVLTIRAPRGASRIVARAGKGSFRAAKRPRSAFRLAVRNAGGLVWKQALRPIR